MKKITILILLISTVLIGCADSKMVTLKSGKIIEVKPYGWIPNDEHKKMDGVKYKVSPGTIVASIILSETIVAPILFTGWYLYSPQDTTELEKRLNEDFNKKILNEQKQENLKRKTSEIIFIK